MLSLKIRRGLEPRVEEGQLGHHPSGQHRHWVRIQDRMASRSHWQELVLGRKSGKTGIDEFEPFSAVVVASDVRFLL